ncbi:MAG: hypothetical protein ACOYNI_07590 [Acidimicrobiia bacterium]
MNQSPVGRNRRDWGDTVLTLSVPAEARALLDMRAHRLDRLEQEAARVAGKSAEVIAHEATLVANDRELLRDTIEATLDTHVTGKNPDQKVFPSDYVAGLHVAAARLTRQLTRGVTRGQER